jgi:hypothetical protein
MGTADSQGRLFAALHGGEDAAGVRRQEGRHQQPGHPEEEEHPLAHGRVISGHRERVGDVVDQEVLGIADPIDGLGDARGLCQGGCGVRLQPGPIDQHVELQHREALGHAANGGARRGECRDDLVPERRGGYDHRIRHVEELLQLGGLPAREQGLGSSQVDHAAHRKRERVSAPRNADLDRRAGLRHECLSGLGAHQDGPRRETSRDDPDGRVVRLISPVEREDADWIADGGTAGGDRVGRKVDEAESVRGGDTGDPRHLRLELLQRQDRRCVRRRRHHLLTAGDRTLESERTDIVDRLSGSDGVRDPHDGVRFYPPDVQAEARRPVGQRALPGDVWDPAAPHRRRAVDVRERRCWRVVHHDLVRRRGTFVGDDECHRRLLPGTERRRRRDPFGQPEAAGGR